MSAQEALKKRSWLVQRLEAPRGAANPFSFGGGLRNGGLSDEAMGLLRGVFSFDYMGAAEFEFGAVPEALGAIASNKRLTAFAFEVPLSKVAKGFRETEPPAARAKATVYVICDERHVDAVKEFVRLDAARKVDLKESTRLSEVLRPSGPYQPTVVGWLELNNGFFFFTDEQMWLNTALLFGVQAGVSL